MQPDSALIPFLIMAAFAGSAGLPLSMPPQPEDPVLAQIAPEHCVYYARCAGLAKSDPQATNSTERFLANPEVKSFGWDLAQKLTQPLQQQSSTVPEGKQQSANELSQWASILLSQPCALYVSSVQLTDPLPDNGPTVGGMSFTVHGGALLWLGEHEDRTAQALRNLCARLAPQTDTVAIQSSKFTRVRLESLGQDLVFGCADGYLVIATDVDEMQGLLSRMKGPIPAWLAHLQEQQAIPRRATLASLQFDVLLPALLKSPRADDFRGLGLDRFEQLAIATGLDANGSIARFEMTMHASSHLSDFEGVAVRAADWEAIPGDAMLAASGRIDLGAVFKSLALGLENLDPNAREKFLQLSDAIAQQSTFIKKLRETLDDSFTIYTARGDGGILTGWVFSAAVRDPKALDGYHAGLLQQAHQLEMTPGRPQVRSVPCGERVFYSLMVPSDGFVWEPSWYVDQERFVVSLFPQALRTWLSEEPVDGGVAKVATCERMLNDRSRRMGDSPPFVAVYADMRSLAESVYPFLQMRLHQVGNSLAALGRQHQWEGPVPRLDLTQFPTLRTLQSLLEPSSIIVRQTEGGIAAEVRGTLPVGNPGMNVPLIAAMLLPYLATARDTALQNAAMKNMQQVALAILNYENATRRLPSSLISKGGKPLLSWRVMILPFMDQQELYNAFDLDEPWDSPSNRKLIERMPDIFKSPGSKCDLGKTNCLGIAGKGGIFELLMANGEAPKIRDVRDGASATIAFVEAADELAVVWTKPDDYIPMEDDPIRGLAGLRGGEVLVGCVDGRIRAVNAKANAEIWKALFTKSGGEAATFP